MESTQAVTPHCKKGAVADKKGLLLTKKGAADNLWHNFL